MISLTQVGLHKWKLKFRYFTHYFSLAASFTDNDVVNFIQCGDEVYASSETTILNRIDPKTLETLERVIAEV